MPRKKYQVGGGPVGGNEVNEVNFPQENPAIVEANEMGQELQSIPLIPLPMDEGIPSVNAQDRMEVSPMGDDVGTGVYKKGGKV